MIVRDNYYRQLLGNLAPRGFRVYRGKMEIWDVVHYSQKLPRAIGSSVSREKKLPPKARGRLLGELVVALKTKQYEKLEIPFSEQDKQLWSEISFYFLGGGLMSSPLGEEIRQEAIRTVEKKMPAEAPKLVTSRFQSDAGLIGAVNFMPQEKTRPLPSYVPVIDLGGSTIKTGITTLGHNAGIVVHNCRVTPNPTWEGKEPRRARANLLDHITNLAARTIKEAEEQFPTTSPYACICTTGLINDNGMITGTSTFPAWNNKDFRLHEEIERRLMSRGISHHVLVINDAVAAGAANIQEAKNLGLQQWGYLGLGSSLGGAIFFTTKA